jgi:hypothetical protein
LTHHAFRQSGANSRIFARSVTRKRHATWRLPLFGALTAADQPQVLLRIGSGLNSRADRWVNIASPIGMLRPE